MEITKTDFEDIVSLAASAQMQVYEKIKPSILSSAARCEMEILGTEGAEKLDKSGDTDILRSLVKEYICIDAVLHEFRKLDLVLTPTGFGVISNNTTSPASKARVDALQEQLNIARERSKGLLLFALSKLSGWGLTTQAIQQIRTPLYYIQQLEVIIGRDTDMTEWGDFRKESFDVDTRIRRLIGNAQMDDIMSKVRSNFADSNKSYPEIASHIIDIMFLHSMHSPNEEERVRYLMEEIEGNSEIFSIYMNSKEYQANHYERFKNKKENGAYFFVG